jgi:hypothetical protein
MESLLLVFHALGVEVVYIKCILHALGRVDFNLSILGSPCCAPDMIRRLITELDDLKSTGMLVAPLWLCVWRGVTIVNENPRGAGDVAISPIFAPRTTALLMILPISLEGSISIGSRC